MITYTQDHSDDAEPVVVIPVVVSRTVYAKLEKLAEICAKQQGTEVEDNDIPDLCEQAIIHALSELHEDYRLEG